MNMKELKRRLDAKATYFWAKGSGTGYKLVNTFTLKTIAGVETRLDALKITKTLTDAGYTVAKLEEQFE